MASRRSLTAVMELSPDKLAFIRGADEQPTTEGVPDLPAKREDEKSRLSTASAGSATHSQSTKRPRTGNLAAHNRHLLPEIDESIVWVSNPLVPLTTRLQPETAAALKRAGLEQRLCGRKPGTVQEIVEVALRSWLHSSGFLRQK